MKRLFTRRLCLIGLVILSWLPSYAQLDEHVRHHVILSIDAKTYRRASKPYLAEYAIDAMFGGDSLLRKGDMISIVNYAASVSDQNLDQYVTPAQTRSGESFLYSPVNDVEDVKRLLRNNWDRFATRSDVESYSLSSVAKPYALASLPFSGEYTNRTFIILVTDHQYNGNDYYQELSYWHSAARSRLTKNDIMQKCYEVESEFFMAYLNSLEVGSVFFDVYECRPLQSSLALSSVLYYAPVLKPERIKGKQYRLRFSFTPQPGKHYSLKRLDIYPRFTDGTTGEVLSYRDREMVVDSLKYPDDKHLESLEVRAWVGLNDGFYNAVVLSPSQDAPDFLGRDGLNVSISVLSPDEAKVFKSRLPECLWWFYPNDPFKCAFVIETAFAVLLFLLIAFLLRSLKTYRPQKNQVHLH